MRKVLWVSLFVVMLLSALPSYAQSPNYDVGPVWRVTYYHIKPGQGDAFWKDFRENLKPVYEEAKKQGLLSDYKVWYNVTTDRPDDWDVAVGTMYPNYAAIDQIDAKAATISTKHYGSREAMIEAGKKRSEIREVVASKLAREVMPK
jgi:phage gpG-like protein